MTDLLTLSTKMLANFRTIRIPCSEDSLPRSPTLSDWRQSASARMADRRAVRAFRDELRAALIKHGYRRFFDDLEADPEGGWRLHFFVADDAAASCWMRSAENCASQAIPWRLILRNACASAWASGSNGVSSNQKSDCEPPVDAPPT